MSLRTTLSIYLATLAIAGEDQTDPEPQDTAEEDDRDWPRPAHPESPHWPAYVARLLDGA